MGFNFASFAGGLAKGGSAALDDRAADKKSALATKRSLMFNATEALYNNALDVKKANDILKNDDKKYISKIKSMDSSISTDNMNKLLSLNVDDRLKAEEEYNYRAAQTDSGVSSFGDFMSYVDDASDLNNPDKITTSIEASMVPAPQTPKAYYDKTGLISDKSVNNLFSEVSGVLADVHGMSIAQAKAITEQGIYSVQHPPIKINWSKDIKVQRGVLEELAKASIYSQNQLKDQALSIINRRVTLTGTAIDRLRESFAASYTTDGVDTDGKPTGKKVKVAAAFASTDPDFESRFLKSPEYLKYAKESISPYIMSMETDPDVNTANAMTYINGTFPGLYGGKIDTQTLTEEAFAAIVPTKIYYVNAPPLTGPANPSGADSDGFIMTGATLKGTRVDGDGDGDGDTTNTDVGVSSTDNSVVKVLKDELAFAKEMGAEASIIARIESEIVDAEDNTGILYKELKAKLKADDKISDKTFEPDAVQMKDWDKNLDVAIEAGDAAQIQLVVDFVEANPDNKIGGSNMSLRNRLYRRAIAAKDDLRYEQNPTLEDTLDKINKVLPGSLLTKPKRIDSDVARAFLKKLDTYPLPENTADLEELNKVKKELYRNI
mgnify:FL=1